MDEENLVAEETLETPTEEVETPETPQEVDIEALQKKADAYEAQKVRAEKAEKALKLKKEVQVESPDALDLIKLGKKLQDYDDVELDFVTNHAKSKKPEDILLALEDEMVQMAIQAKRQKVEKEKLSLKPSGTQVEMSKSKTLSEALKSADMNEKEELLKKYGLYKSPSPRRDDRAIGRI